MKYLMLVCCDAAAFEAQTAKEDAAETVEDGDGDGDDSFPWLDEMISRGIRLDGDRVRPPSEATSVRVRGGDVLISDGPFAESKEAIAGYDVIECASLEEAVEVASKHPVAEFGTIEVRPFWK
jgi:hypothetical protein